MWEIKVTCTDGKGIDAFSVSVESLESVGQRTDELIASAICEEKMVTGVHVYPVF